MKRSNELMRKRKAFVDEYYEEATRKGKSVKAIVIELSEKLFITDRTVYAILAEKGNY